MEPRIVADYASPLGEGPLWHPMERRLYWLDIEGAQDVKETTLCTDLSHFSH